MENLTEKEKMLWKIAKKRVSFRRHLATYLIMSCFFWAVWYFTAFRNGEREGIPWPLFSMLGWGIGIAFHFVSAYVTHDRVADVEKEFEKLKNKSN